MARAPRPLQAGLTLHLTAHAIPDLLCCPDNDARARFLQLALKACGTTLCQVHAYALMDNHVHLLLSSLADQGVARLMARLLGRHTALLNRLEGRIGPRWHQRYASLVIKDEAHLVNSYLYIEANPWRAGLVEHPARSTWTSYGFNALGRVEELLTPHAVVLHLAQPGEDWRSAYSRLMEEYLKTAVRYKGAARLPLTTDPLAGLHVCMVDPR